jgi:ribose-phosphate pyrophosphokinase
MIKLLSNGVDVPFTLTIFPDGTSQVWKMDTSKFDNEAENKILWLFENEGEIIHVAQLAQLCYELDSSVDLVCPYLPYGRQDKNVDNKLSFALTTFKEILYNAGITRIEAFDPHSKTDMIYSMIETTPADFHRSILAEGKYDLVCFPDKGAAERYSRGTSTTAIYAEKVRDQLSGVITGLKIITNGEAVSNKKILIIDDICDGGMTFIKVVEALRMYKPGQVDLAVSHGFFSKGKQVLLDAGITNIFTTNSMLRNPEGFKVW